MINTVLFDCSGSMSLPVSGNLINPTAPDGIRMDLGFKLLNHLFKKNYIHKGTPIVAFDHSIRGGVTFNLINPVYEMRTGPFINEVVTLETLRMSNKFVFDLFDPNRGTNIYDALAAYPEGDILLITDEHPKIVEKAIKNLGRKNVIVAIIDEREPSGMYYL